MDSVLVTGGAGYVGSHVCKALARAGYNPIVFDNLCNGYRKFVKWGEFVEGDLLNSEDLSIALRKHRPVAVLHFAALAYVGESVRAPATYYRNNVVGTLNLLDAMLEANVERLVFSSTCATFGLPQREKIDELHAQNPINPYGMSKLMIERILRDYDAAYGLRSISLRYFNAAGADCDGEIGEAHDPETHLIPLVLQTALGERPAIDVFGTDFATPDGTCIRDYVHVEDLAQAHVLALRALERGAATTAYNLGNGCGYSVREVIDVCERVTARKIVWNAANRREGDPPVLIADSHRARRELGWRPQYESLEEIVASAWRWHSSAQQRSNALESAGST
jgi:UDP-arabinose 4-epimerase